jgi:hypothetical protein
MENKFLYFTFQSSQNFEPTSAELKSFQRKYKKDFTNRIVFEGEELIEQYRLRGWKHPRYSKIVSFIVAFELAGELKVKYITGSEKDLIQEFCNILRKSQEYKIVTFDSQIVLPYIGIRMARNGFTTTPNVGISYKNMRPWDLKCLDLQQYYDGAGNYKSSLKDIAEDLNLACDDIIEFEEEFLYYTNADFNSLKKSAIQKVEVMSKAHRILESLQEVPTILIEDLVENVQEIKPTNVFKELNITKQLTLETKEMLKTLFTKKKLSKKDKELTFNLVRASLCDIDPNFGKVKNEKEVDMIINQLKEEFENN